MQKQRAGQLRYVQSLFFLIPKFEAYSQLLWLYILVCVGPGWKPEDRFSHDADHISSILCLFNLSLISFQKANAEDQGDNSSQSVSKADRLGQVSQDKQGAVSKTTESVAQKKLSEISHGASPQGTNLPESYQEKCNISGPKGSSGARAKSQPSQSMRDSVPNTSNKNSSSNEQTDYSKNLHGRDKDSNTYKRKEQTAQEQTAKEPSAGNEPGQENKLDLPSVEHMDHKCDSQGRAEGASGPAKVADFWEVYKSWAEKRCLSKFELLERHVNQLFIRGDNVVSVSVAQ